MSCVQVRDKLGMLLDGELDARERETVRTHLEDCAACREEWERLEQLSASLEVVEEATRVEPPMQLWAAIERELDVAGGAKRRPGVVELFRKPLAMAASVALLIGAALLFSLALDHSAQPVQASVIDYRILMDGITADVHGAINRFLQHYHAEPVDLKQAHASAPGLSFDIPEELAGGHRLIQAYKLRFGKSPGVGAVYDRGDDPDPLFVFFHPTSDNTAGPRGSTCLVGDLHGSQIQVGPWRLLHIMDSTTCHCVLTTLEPGSQLEEVIRAVAPDMPAEATHHHEHAH